MFYKFTIILVALSLLLVRPASCNAIFDFFRDRFAARPREPFCEFTYERDTMPELRIDYKYTVTISLPLNPDRSQDDKCSYSILDAIKVGPNSMKVPWGGGPKVKNGNCVLTVIVWGRQDYVDPTKERSPPFRVRDAVQCYAQAVQPPLPYPQTCVRFYLSVLFCVQADSLQVLKKGHRIDGTDIIAD